jgi:hypothetical protein
METSTASTDTATTIDEIRVRHAASQSIIARRGEVSINVLLGMLNEVNRDRAYLLNLIKRIEEGINFRWSDNEGEVTNGITELLNA